MSKKLMTRGDGGLAFVSSDPEWFHLGATHDHLLTAEEVLYFTGMDSMRFSSHEVLATVGDENTTSYRKMPQYKAVILEELHHSKLHPAGVVGRNREVFQFDQLIEPMASVLDVSGGRIETAGVFEGGAEWFCFVKLPKDVTIGGDEHVMYLLGHDSLFTSLTIAPTMKRLWCLNMFSASLARASQHGHAYRLKHRRGARINVAEVRHAIDVAYESATELDDISKVLASKEMEDVEFLTYVDSLFGTPGEDAQDFVIDRYHDRNRTLLNMFLKEREQTATTHRDGRPTAWTAFQTVSEWMDHYSPVRDRQNTTARRMERLVTGRFEHAKASALEVLL